MTLAGCGGDEAPGAETSTAPEPAPSADPSNAPTAPTDPATPPVAADPATEPSAVVERYLRGAADPASVAALVDDTCPDTAQVRQVADARIMGAPIAITTIEVNETARDEQTASVSFSLTGDAHSEGAETELFGATVRTGAVDVQGATRSGVLQLRRVAGAWKVTCPPAARTTP